MAARPSVKAWNNMSPEELLAKHEELVASLQDPAYASIDPSSVKSGSPMHMTTRGTLDALESHMDTLGIKYQPSAGRILPIPGTAPAPAIIPPSGPTVTTGPTPGAVPPTPTVTTGPTPGAVPPTPTVTTGPTPGAVPPTPTVTTGPTPPKKPIGRPVISANTTAPTPTAAGAQQTAQATTQSGNAVPPPKATIHSNAPTPPRLSSGAPAKAPGKMRALADDVSAAVTQGPNGARNLKMLGIAGALGVAGFGLSRAARSVQDENETNKRLEMQRRGII